MENGKIRLTAKTAAKLPDGDSGDSVRFCPKCGRRIPSEQAVCAFCQSSGTIPRPTLPLKQKLRYLLLILGILFILLVGLDLVMRSMGPLPAPVPAVPSASGSQGTSVPVILLP